MKNGDTVQRYRDFLNGKMHLSGNHGFEPTWIPDEAFDFQRELITWSVRKGRAAIFADCGLGKTLMQLAWAENVVRRSNGRVLLLTPLAVAAQTVREGAKFGIECKRSSGELSSNIIVTNYQKLHHFNATDFVGVVCDESSILKNFDGATRGAITEFARKLPYRLLCTATAAPNDYIELGTSSEALGELGHMDMLNRFFKNDLGNSSTGRGYLGGANKFRFRGHAEQDFWRWVGSWARALRKPSDLGFSDDGFDLPPLTTNEHLVEASRPREGMLFSLSAVGLQEQRAERRHTLRERCEKAAALVVDTGTAAVCWCHLNPEGDLLKALIPGAVQVSGADSDEAKEEAFEAFASGQIRVLVTKPTVAGFGLNWQHCHHQTFFPSHSFEQWYQSIRRSWRYGQTHPVTVDVISSSGEAGVLASLQRKARAAEVMFEQLVGHMATELKITTVERHTKAQELPTWLS